MSKSSSQSEIAGRLREARKRLFKTASEAAEALDMKAVTLRAHENGQNGINIVDAERYARRYNVNLQWLLTGKGAQLPDPSVHIELGEMIDVEGMFDPQAWLPNDDPSRVRQKFRKVDIPEEVPYTDPRFPASMVSAFKLASASQDAQYIQGTIIFCIESYHIGFQAGDHVLVIRERGDFTNVSLRLAVAENSGGHIFKSLTHPEEPDLHWDPESEARLNVSAVVIGSLTRRPVAALDIQALRDHEAYERSRHFTAADWMKMRSEAQSIANGYRDISTSEIFDTMDQVREFLKMT